MGKNKSRNRQGRGRRHDGHGPTSRLPHHPPAVGQPSLNGVTPGIVLRDSFFLMKPRHGPDGRGSRRTLLQVEAEIYVCLNGFDFRAPDKLDHEDLAQFAESAVLIHKSSSVFVKRVSCFFVQLMDIMWDRRSQYHFSTTAVPFFEDCLSTLVGQKFAGSITSSKSIGPLSGPVAMRVFESFASARLNTLKPQTADPHPLDVKVNVPGRPGDFGMGKKTASAKFDRKSGNLAAPVQQRMDKWIKFVAANSPKHGDASIKLENHNA